MSDEKERMYLFSEERRTKADAIMEKVEAHLAELKVNGYIPTDARFKLGMQYAMCLTLGMLAITVTDSEVNDTVEEIINDLLSAAALTLASVSG